MTGFAIFDLSPTEYRLVDSGVIQAWSKTVDDIVVKHWRWLEEELDGWRYPLEVAFEEALHVRSLPSDTEATEARGIIRLVCNTAPNVVLWKSYLPPTVKALLTGKGNANKKQVGEAVKRLCGVARFKIDHIPDAIAVGATHMAKEYGMGLDCFALDEGGAD